MPQEVAGVQKEFHDALAGQDIKGARAALQKLEQLIGPDRPIAVELRTTYELERALTED